MSLIEILKWIIDNYGTVTAGLAIALSLFLFIKKWHKHAINSINLSIKFYDIFGNSPAQEIEGLCESIREEQSLLEIRQQISERYLKIGVYITDLEGKCTWTNDYLNQIFGRDSKDMLGFGWLIGIHKDDRNRIHGEWMYSVNNKIEFSSDYVICNGKNDLAIEVTSSAVAVVNDKKERQCYIGYVTINKITENCCSCEDKNVSKYEKS